MEGARAVTSPGGTPDREMLRMLSELEGRMLNASRAKRYRAASARLNYLAQDRLDLGFVSKPLAQAMSSPSEADEMRMKRLVRYLKGCPRAVFHYPWQEPITTIRCQMASDWG